VNAKKVMALANDATKAGKTYLTITASLGGSISGARGGVCQVDNPLSFMTTSKLPAAILDPKNDTLGAISAFMPRPGVDKWSTQSREEVG